MELNTSLACFSVSDIHKNITLPKQLSPLLSELIGIHVGDGYLGYRRHKQEFLIQCMGNPATEKEHYTLFIRPTWKKLFNIDIVLRPYQNGCFGYMLYSKAIGMYFNKVLGLPIGKKSATIGIPPIIPNHSSEILAACIRGIIDTDFYLHDDRGTYELAANFASKRLVEDLTFSLRQFGFQPITYYDQKYYNCSSCKELVRHKIRIRRKQDIELWKKIIGSHNPKFYKRLSFPQSSAPVV